jgi:hypothetical protein
VIPTIGRIVHYTLSQYDADAINRRYRHFDAYRAKHAGDVVPGEPGNTGHVGHYGNNAQAGDVLPAIIVRVWGDTAESAVNLQVHLDGSDVYWATSRTHGDGQGHWHWPLR